MRIAIVTTGRFHVCDLARELNHLGHDVRFYSLVPPWRTAKFGLPRECNRWMLPRVPFAAAKFRLARSKRQLESANENLLLAYDRAVAKVIEPCDVLIGMSGMCNEVGLAAKKKYGAQVWIERGSRHILSQKEILDAIPNSRTVSMFSVERELHDYKQADTVVLLSSHTHESFIEKGFKEKDLFLNPLGVNLDDFFPMKISRTSRPTVITTGAWSYQKGSDILADVISQLHGVQLMHVGSVLDCPLPNAAWFKHYATIPQKELVRFYGQAHMFALLSRQDGFGMVILQALACGLPVVCSNRTGAPDLVRWVQNPSAIRIVDNAEPKMIITAIEETLNSAVNQGKRTDFLGEIGKSNLSWTAYGQRYETELRVRYNVR